MNFPIRSFALPAAALAFPLALLAQTPSSSTPTTPGATGTGATHPTNSTSPGSIALPRESSMRGDVGDRALSSGNSLGIAAVRRVTQDGVDRQLTAKALIGKAVYDNQGHRVGEVKDVILDATGAPALAGAFSQRNSKDAADRSGTSLTAGNAGGMSTSTPSATSTTPGSGSDYASSSSSTDHNAASTSASESRMNGSSTNPNGIAGDATGSSLGQRNLSNSLASAAGGANSPAAIISSGGFLGMGDNLLRVPLNQLSYDGSNDRITLNVSQAELSSLPNPSETAKSAAE